MAGNRVCQVGSRGIYKICQDLDPIGSSQSDLELNFGLTNKSSSKLVILKKLKNI